MYDREKIRILMEKVFDDMYAESRNKNSLRYQEYRRDFGFHMTDWLRDLERLSAVYRHPEKTSVADASSNIMGFLYHAIPHLAAAGRLLLEEVPDAFADMYHPPKRTAKRRTKKARVRRAG